MTTIFEVAPLACDMQRIVGMICSPRLVLVVAVSCAMSACAPPPSSQAPGEARPLGDIERPQPRRADPPSGGKVDYLIIAGDRLAASAERYRAFRAASGHVVELALVGELSRTGATKQDRIAAIGAHVRARYEQGRDLTRPFYLLLIGDADEHLPVGTYHDPYRHAEIPSDISSDNLYADIDGDHLPDLSVGRIPANTDEQVDQARERVAAYERDYRVGPWNRRLNAVASSAGFGPTYDQLIGSFITEILDSLSYSYDVVFSYGLEGSEYVHPPERFSDRVYQQLNSGSLVTAYIGHGDKESLAPLEWRGASYPILDHHRLDEALRIENKAPLLLLIACWTGAFDHGDSLAEQLQRHPHGPAAVIASTEISHPYANVMLVRELAAVATEQQAPTVGLLLDRAKRRLVGQDDLFRSYLELIASAIFSEEERIALRRMHVHMYPLLGDPAMRIQYVRGGSAVAAVEPVARRGRHPRRERYLRRPPPRGRGAVLVRDQPPRSTGPDRAGPTRR